MRRVSRKLLRPVPFAGLLLLLLAGLPARPPVAVGRSYAPDAEDLEKVLKGAAERRREYVEAFRNLTAEEIKLTEVFGRDGRIKEQRRMVSAFLVYGSQVKEGVVNEYRAVREVDGRALGEQAERAEKLFERLARARTLEAEWKRLRDENLRYTLRFYRWDVTLHPAAQLEEKSFPHYSYEIAGRENLDGRETILISYSRKSLRPARADGILKQFRDPQVGERGRLWLDADTLRLRRWENEHIVRHTQTGKILVYLRDEADYGPSDLGILVPRRIVASFLNELRQEDDKEPRTLMGGRITYTYGPFRRFEVTAGYELRPAEKE